MMLSSMHMCLSVNCLFVSVCLFVCCSVFQGTGSGRQQGPSGITTSAFEVASGSCPLLLVIEKKLKSFYV